MKIININADENICSKVLEYFDFIDSILAPQRNKLMEINRINLLKYNHIDNNEQLPKVRMFEVFDYANVANLIRTIPIFLYKKAPEKRDVEPKNSIDPLGAYITSGKNNPSVVNEPYIELYVSKIYEEAEEDDVKFKYQFALTLLHELGHAALDINNCSWYATPFDNGFTYTDKNEYDKELTNKNYEEGMANAIAYRIIKESRFEPFTEYARSFIEKQPNGYEKGCEFEKELEQRLKDYANWKMDIMDEKRKKLNVGQN